MVAEVEKCWQCPSVIPGRRSMGGFTLIELMVIVAVVGVLSSVALPAYQSYTVRAKVSEGVALLSDAKIGVWAYYDIQGALPPGGSNTLAGIPDIDTPYVIGLTWLDDQRIEIDFDETALGISGTMELQLDPEINNGQITWRCGHDQDTSSDNIKYSPPNCRTRYW